MYYGCKKEQDDKRDYKMKVAKTIQLPESFILDISNVKNQGIVNSCVAYSLSTFLETLHLKDNKIFSTGFIYGYRPLGYSQEEGMYPREAIKTLQKLGDVENQYFDHNKEIPEIKKLVDQNISELKSLALPYKINSYARIYTITDIKNCLLNNCLVPISIPVKNNLRLDENFVVLNEGNIEGYHMIILYGWNEKGFLFQNSWGKYWGNEGRAILPYDYPIDSAWAISTDNNSINTYQNILQKLYNLVLKIINIFKEK